MGQSHRRPTIHDVAREAGVSKSLVSLVLRGSPKVSDPSRRAVLRAVNALDYQPNAFARGLVERRTRTVGVVASDLHNPFFVELIDGILEAAGEFGYRVLLGTGRRREDEEEEVFESLLGLPADGVILLSPLIPLHVMEGRASGAPVVVTGRPDANVADVVSIVDDDVAGAVLAVGHLVALGHRRIAHLSGGDGPGAAERRRGYEDAMARAGLSAFVQVAPGEFTDEGGYQAARLLLEAAPFPTAIFAANDFAAVGALTALVEAGLQVPRDVSLVGYDDTHLAALRHVSLTSIDQPQVEMGRLAVRALHESLTTGLLRRHIVLSPTLVVRGSTAPPPSS